LPDAIGNLAMQRLLSRSGIQAKLTISQHGDPDEREADRVADRVMRMAEPGPVHSAPSVIQRKRATCEAGGATCASCDEEEKVRRKESAGQASFQSTAAPRGLDLTSAPPIVHEALSSPGQPLGTTERAFLEPRFGQDFSGVRVHTGAKAAESAAAVQARAYTVGSDIVFGGKESASDLPILAHELTHVVQQSGASPALQRLAYCTDFLEQTRRPGVRENTVRDSLAADAAPFGTVETELFIPAGSFDPWRTIPGPRRDPSVTHPQIIDPIIRKIGQSQGDGRADIGLLDGETLEVIEVKEATWNMGLEAESQLSNYLSKAEDSPDVVNELWRARDHPADEITSVTAMPMTRLSLEPNPRAIGIGGQLVSLRWCRDGIIVFKVEPPEEEEQEDKKPKDDEPGPSDSIPEHLLKLGEHLAKALAAAGLLDIGLAIAGVLGSIVSSPLVALAAVILGIAFFWDKFKWLGSKIAGAAQWVWDKIAGLAEWVFGRFTWLLGKLYELGIKLAELGSWLAGKIAWLAGKLAEGLEWIGGKIAAGGRWLGHKIASAAEAIWDWLWGSDVEQMDPIIIDIPITEETQHCATVAYEDTIFKLDSDLLFPFDEWELKDDADAPLKQAAAKVGTMLQKDDWIKFEGYTDNIGGAEYNRHLSEQRAEAVRSWFVEHGVVPMSRTRIEGYGKTMARANDEEGRKKDRRVDILLPKHGSTKRVCW